MMARGGDWSRCPGNTNTSGPSDAFEAGYDRYYGSKHSMKQHRFHSLPETHTPRVTAACRRFIPSATESGPVHVPEAVATKQGLTEDCAFTGDVGGGGGGGSGSGSGSGNGSSASSPSSGAFGLGHLLLGNHNVNVEQPDTGHAKTQPSRSASVTRRPQERISRDMDAFEQLRLVQNDPISFNPMAAIGWARLNDGPVEEEKQDQDDPVVCTENRRPVSQRPSRPPTFPAKAKRRQRCRNGGGKNAQSVVAATPKRTGERGVKGVGPDPLPYSKMMNIFPTKPRQTADTTESCSPSPSTSTPSRVLRSHTKQASAQQHSKPLQDPQVRERELHHRAGTKADQAGPCASSSASPISADTQQTIYPSLSVPTCAPSSMPVFPATQPIMVEPQAMPFHGSLLQSQQQVSLPQFPGLQYVSTPPIPPLPPQPQQPQPPHQQYDLQQQQDPFQGLCLEPRRCSAPVPAEAQLNTFDGARQDHACEYRDCNSTGFTSKNALMWHVRSEHLMLCPKPGCCNEKFLSKRQLDLHVRVH